MIKICNLSASYNDEQVLEDLNLDMAKGGLYAMIGQSGSGKSTLLKILCGIKKDYTGSIEFNGKAYRDQELSIGYVPQNYGLLDWKTVAENIYLPHKLRKSLNKEAVESISEALKIRELFNKYPREISGGQKQRVALARAFSIEPNLLLMDEPFSALDAFTSLASQELFLKIWTEHKVTALLITHNISEAISVGQNIIIMDKAQKRLSAIIENTTFGGKGDSRERAELADRIMELCRPEIAEAANE